MAANAGGGTSAGAVVAGSGLAATLEMDGDEGIRSGATGAKASRVIAIAADRCCGDSRARTATAAIAAACNSSDTKVAAGTWLRSVCDDVAVQAVNSQPLRLGLRRMAGGLASRHRELAVSGVGPVGYFVRINLPFEVNRRR